jgi:hypothetical protein
MMLGRLTNKTLEAASDVSDDDDDDDDDDEEEEEEEEEDDNDNDVGEGDGYSNQSSLTNRFVNSLVIT